MDYTGITSNEKRDDGKEHLTWNRLLKIGFHLWRQFDDTYYAGFAAQIAYFFFMSSIPMLIVVTQILGIFDVSVDFIKEWLELHLSSKMSSFLQGLFSASSTGFTNVLMIVLALWASSALVFSLARLATYTLSSGKYRFNFFTERVKAIVIAMISILVAVSAVIVYVYGEMIARRVFSSPLAVRIISEIKTPALFFLFFVIVLGNYFLLPRIRVPLRAVLPGAVVATVGITIVTMFYSLYIEKAIDYNLLYGAFSNIVALLLWFYCIAWVLCIGMMFNKSWDIHMKRGRLHPDKLKEYMYTQYGEKGPEMYNKLFIGDYDMYDKSLDTLAVKFSRKFDPGYNEKREQEIRQLREEQRVRDKVEQQIRNEIEYKDVSDKSAAQADRPVDE